MAGAKRRDGLGSKAYKLIEVRHCNPKRTDWDLLITILGGQLGEQSESINDEVALDRVKDDLNMTLIRTVPFIQVVLRLFVML